MAPTKKDLSSYITTVSKVKPSAEVKFKTTNEDGVVEETIASKTYVAEHADKEFDAASTAREFLQASDQIEISLADFIFARLIEYPGQLEIHSNHALVSKNL